MDPIWLHFAQFMEQQQVDDQPSIIQPLSAMSLRSQITTGTTRTGHRLGTDISALEGLSFSYHEGLRNLAEALARRLLTPRGALFYDRTYGFDVRSYLNEADTPQTRFELATQADTELSKDPRVLASETSITSRAPDHIDLNSQIEVRPGEFRLILRVSEMEPAHWEVNHVPGFD